VSNRNGPTEAIKQQVEVLRHSGGKPVRHLAPDVSADPGDSKGVRNSRSRNTISSNVSTILSQSFNSRQSMILTELPTKYAPGASRRVHQQDAFRKRWRSFRVQAIFFPKQERSKQ
jgi:hypothetical protein